MAVPGGKTAIFGKPKPIRELAAWYPRVPPPPLVRFRRDYAPGGGTGLYLLNQVTARFLELSSRLRSVVELCDGSRTADEVAEKAAGAEAAVAAAVTEKAGAAGAAGATTEPAAPITARDAVFADLDALQRDGHIFWTDGPGDGGAAGEMVRRLGEGMDRFGRAGDLLWLSAGKRTGMSYLYAPVALTLILTLRCNARCSICFVRPTGERRHPAHAASDTDATSATSATDATDATRATDAAGATDVAKAAGPGVSEIETAEVLRLLRQAAELGVDRVRLFGGEALLRDDLPDILRRGRDLNLGLALYSNGIALAAEEKVAELAAIMDGYPYFYVQVSIDGLGAAHDRQRPGARAAAVKRAVENLARHGITFATNTVLNRENVAEIEDITAFAHEHGARNIIFNSIKLCGGGSELEASRLSPAEVRDLWGRFARLRARYPDQEIYPNLQDTIERARQLAAGGVYPKKVELEADGAGEGGDGRDGLQKRLAHNCLAFTYSMAIAPDGAVLPCEFFAPFPKFWRERIQGRDLKWAWDESEIAHFMRKLPIAGKCQVCEYRDACDMGCPVENRMVAGSFVTENPFCWYEPGRPASADELPRDHAFIHRAPVGRPPAQRPSARRRAGEGAKERQP